MSLKLAAFGSDPFFSDLEVSADGTKILAPIPANAEKGFMVLRSGN